MGCLSSTKSTQCSVSFGLVQDLAKKLKQIPIAQCGNCGNSLSHLFGKNFVKVTVLLNKLLKSGFHEIFFSEIEFLVFPHGVLLNCVCVCGCVSSIVIGKCLCSSGVIHIWSVSYPEENSFVFMSSVLK